MPKTTKWFSRYTCRLVSESTSDSGIAPSQPRPAELVRTISADGGIAVRSLIGSNLIAEAMNRRALAPTAANALGRALMGAVLMAVEPGAPSPDLTARPSRTSAPPRQEEGESVQLQFRGQGPLGNVVAISDSLGRVRGTVENPEVNDALQDGTPDVARALGLGSLTVVRHNPRWREPYSGTVPLVSGEIAGDITLYLTESEQVPSAMGLSVAMTDDESAVVAVGFLVQIMPDASDAEIAQVERNVASLPKLSQLALSSTTPDELIDLLLAGLGSRTRYPGQAIYFCPCTRERALRTLSLLGSNELEEMVSMGESQEVCCHFCSRAYQFGTSEIASVIPAI
jgi:molecular chaperone Hsp33